MTVGYFAKSIFQETCILCNFMVTNISDLLDNLWRSVSQTIKLFFPAKDTKSFTLFESIKRCEKKSVTGPTTSTKTNLKAYMGYRGNLMTEIL